MIQIADSKMVLDAMIMANTKEEISSGVGVSEVLSMIKFGAQSLFSSGGQDITDEDIDQILQRSMKKTEKPCEKMQDCEFDLDSFETKELFLVRSFQGEYHEQGPFKDTSDSWVNLPKREITFRIKNGIQEPIRNFSDGMVISQKEKKISDDNCFVCKKRTTEQCCNAPLCTKMYHKKCVVPYNRKQNGFTWICPYHSCCGCSASASKVGGYLFRCDNCPNSYCNSCRSPKAKLVGKRNSDGQAYTNIMFILCAKCEKME